MKVSVVYNFFPHYRSTVLRDLQESHLDVGFIADTRADAIEKSIKVLVPEKNFDTIRILRLTGSKYWLLGLSSALLKQRPNKVIFLGDPNCLNLWILCPILRACGVEVFFWTHGWLNANEPYLKRKFRVLFLSLANQILVYGRRARTLIAKQGFDPRRVHVIYNSLDYKSQCLTRETISYDEARQFLGDRIGKALNGQRIVLCSARLTQLKRFDLVIKAVAKVTVERPMIVFVGEGPIQSELQELADSLGVECHFLGACYDEDVLGKVFMASSVVVSPGNVGLTAMHAMAYGLPVISHSDFDHQMPEVESVVPDVTGYLFERDCVDSLADTLIRHFAKSAEEVAAMRVACIAMVEQFFNAQNQVRKIVSAVENKDEVEPLRPDIPLAELSALGTSDSHGRVEIKPSLQTA